MAVPLQISYRDVSQSDALDTLVANEAAKLERYFGRILGCRVLIEHAHEHQRSGAPFQVRITLNIPGEDVFINQEPDIHDSVGADDEARSRVQKRASVDAAYKDPALAVRSAFRKARRQLQDRIRLKREASFRY